MDFATFGARAWEMFEEIPLEYRQGVEGLSVVEETAMHPDLEEIYTLGECVTESYPGEFGGPGEVQSTIVLYYGSFRALATEADRWDWEGELWETITHEAQHHLESLALEESLEVRDYAEDQNYCRRDGKPFEAVFYRLGHEVGPDLYEVGGDLFMEMRVSESEFVRLSEVVFRGDGMEISVPRPDRLGDVHFLTVADAGDEAGERVVVLVKRRGLVDWVRNLFSSASIEILESRPLSS